MNLMCKNNISTQQLFNMLQGLRWCYCCSLWLAQTHGDGVPILLVPQDRNQNVQKILKKTFQTTSLTPLTAIITSSVTAAEDPFADDVHPQRTSTPKHLTAFGRFKQVVSTTKQPDGRVCYPQYAAQTDNAMKKGRQRGTMYNVVVITSAGMGLR